MASIRREIDIKIEKVEAEINSVRNEIKALSEKIDIIKDVEQMKARLTQLEARH